MNGKHLSLRNACSGLAKILPAELIGQILTWTVSADADPNLSDAEAEAVEAVFDMLQDYRPESVDHAFESMGLVKE